MGGDATNATASRPAGLLRGWAWRVARLTGWLFFLGLNANIVLVYGLTFVWKFFPPFETVFALPGCRVSYWGAGFLLLLWSLSDPHLDRFSRRMTSLTAFWASAFGALSEYHTLLSVRGVEHTVIYIEASAQLASLVVVGLELRRTLRPRPGGPRP